MTLPERIDLRRVDEYLSSFESCMVCDARNISEGVVKVETSGLKDNSLLGA